MSIRAKILLIISGSMGLLGLVFLFYAFRVSENAKRECLDKVSCVVMGRSEQINTAIARMEQNAVDLATAGETYFLATASGASNASDERIEKTGERLVVDNFRGMRVAVGGGIWFEPNRFFTDRKYYCFYACYNERGEVSSDPNFSSEQYDYPEQVWYKQIRDQLRATKKKSAWSQTYFDEMGTFSLMTTVGSGIYDASGVFVGMSTVDWEMNDAVHQLAEIRPTTHSFVTLVDTQYRSVLVNTLEKNPEKHAFLSVDSLPWYRDLKPTSDEQISLTSLVVNGTEYLSFGRKLDNGMDLFVQIPVSEMTQFLNSHNQRAIVAVLLLAAAILGFSVFYLTTRINQPLEKLVAEMQAIGSGRLDVSLDTDRNDELGQLAQAFNKMTVDLKDYIQRLREETAAKQRISSELEVARSIQISALPNVFPPFPDSKEFDLFAMMKTAKQVGGDFYDFVLVGNQLTFTIADVSGKGVPAAMFMMTAKTLLKNLALTGASPAEILENANNCLCESNEAGMFVTVFLGKLDILTGKLVYANAGHLPPLWRRGKTGSFDWLPIQGDTFVLGMIENMPYEEHETVLGKDDQLILYTDGVTEAVDPQKKLFGAARFQQTMNAMEKDLTLEQTLSAIWNAILQYGQGAEQADDTTMLAVHFHGKR